MSEPRTEAGREALGALGERWGERRLRILAIEAEAHAAALAELRAKVLQMANVAAEKRPMSHMALGYERACDEVLDWAKESRNGDPA